MSSADDLRVAVALPEGFSAADLAAPDLSQSPQIAVEIWASAHAPTEKNATLAWGCFRGDESVWSVDATELAQGKLAEIASGTGARMRGRASPMHVVSEAREGRERSLALDDGAGSARTVVLFTRAGGHESAHGCFIACTSASCEHAVTRATFTGALVDPPPPGVALRTLSLVVHHPHGALAAAFAVFAASAALAIATRPGKGRK